MSSSKILGILIFFLFTFGLLTFRTFCAEEDPCLMCHVKLKEPAKSIHAALGMGCHTCHIPAEGKIHPDQKDSIKLTQGMPGLCYSCHDESKFKGKSTHPPVVSGLCTGCHNAHQSNFKKILLKDLPGLCFNCHSESKFKGKSVHVPAGRGLCTSCHDPHASNSNKMLISDSPELCYRCHEKKPFTKKYVHVVITLPHGCNLCHGSHVSDYPYLLSNSINEVCISCHKGKETGRHIVSSLPGRIIHPIKGVLDPSNPTREISCISCHDPHSSDFAKLFPAARICHRCHPSY